MSESQAIILFVAVCGLILLSAFFSGSETGLMSLNRYRLRHKARLKKGHSVLIVKLLKRPDRLLGLILIGNSIANILASAFTTLLAVHFWGDTGVVISTVILTFMILVFAEVAPKTLAALYSERVSDLVAWPIHVLLKVFYPLVWFINFFANGVLRLFRINLSAHHVEPLSREELRSVVYDTAGKVSHQYQTMLLGILDLNKASVDDVMIPRHEIKGIDIEQDWLLIQQQIVSSEYDWLPIYRENINQIVGILHLRDLTRAMVLQKVINKEMLLGLLQEPYFVPEGAQLNVQLVNFQQQRKRIALVVDEYGEIQGLLTLEDILEEIVGEFTTNVSGESKVQPQPDHSFLVDGSITVRELNRAAKLAFPIRGPKTLNGLIVEYLETIPRAGICVRFADYPIEIMEVEENRIKLVRIFPRLTREESGDII